MFLTRTSLIIGTVLTATTALAATAGAFVDVSVNHPNATAISYVKAQGIVSGYPDGTYRADKTINRAEFTKIVVNAAAKNSLNASCNNGSMSFIDVPTNEWYSPFVCAAKSNGIISGNPDGTFRPNATINFAEAAKILVKAYALPLGSDSSVWWKPYTDALAMKNAMPSSYRKPDQLVTRGEMAEMIWRINNPGQQTGNGCKTTGCSSHLCVDERDGDVVSTCEWRDEYACYQTARCERQASGQCGWTQTSELQSCLSGSSSSVDRCPVMDCQDGYECRNSQCIKLSANAAVYTDYKSSVIGNGQKSILFFYAAWCPLCRDDDEKLKDWYDGGVATLPTYRVNYDEETALKSKYGVTYQHTYVVIDGSGNAIQTLELPSDEQVLALIKG